ncbi:MAG: BrnT family toxin [Thermoanaerobaculia bacterium]
MPRGRAVMEFGRVALLTECTRVHTIDGYEWSHSKATANRWKHGVDFADAVTVFTDDFALTVEEKDAAERRWVTVGCAATGEILLVVYTWRGRKIRVISARKAASRERLAYEASEKRRYERNERGVRFHPRDKRGGRTGSGGEDADHDPAGR